MKQPNDRQGSLFGARNARDRSLREVIDAADEEWKRAAWAAIEIVARTHATFGADTVWEYGLPKPRVPRAIGPIMIRAVREGLCEKIGYVRQGAQRSRHAAPIMVYRSLVFQAVSP